MQVDRPYFMSNVEWFDFDVVKGIYVTTDKAPPEAIQSYKEFYELLEQDTIELPKKQNKLNTLVSINQARKIIK